MQMLEIEHFSYSSCSVFEIGVVVIWLIIKVLYCTRLLGIFKSGGRV